MYIIRNTIFDLMDYFEIDYADFEKRQEFRKFWDSLSEDEKDYYRFADI